MTKPATSTDYRPRGRPFTGRKMLATIVGFFAVVVSVNLLMAWLAVRNFPGVVVDSSYIASQHFNADHARGAAQAARGWVVEVREQDGRPTLALTGPDGAPLSGLSVVAKAVRPLDAHGDAALTLVEASPGVWRAEERLAPGRWRIAFVARGIGADYAATAPLMVEAR
jgi:nitrogen fixation protein FixH